MISQRYNISPLLAKLLNIRNISDENVNLFLDADLKNNLPKMMVPRVTSAPVEIMSLGFSFKSIFDYIVHWIM